MTAVAGSGRFPPRLRLALQIGCALAGLFVLEARRPADGTALLIPLTPGARAALPALMLDGTASLVGTGIVPGSLVVRRSDGAIPALLSHGILSIAVPFRGCVTGARA